MSAPVEWNNQAAIEAEEDEKRNLKLKNRQEMEKMLAANQDLHQRRAERISEEQAVSSECRRHQTISKILEESEKGAKRGVQLQKNFWVTTRFWQRNKR